jgi:hypothetical protein
MRRPNLLSRDKKSPFPVFGIRSRRAPVHAAVMRIGRCVAVLAALCLFGAETRVAFPPVPSPPSAGWPRPEIAEPFTRELNRARAAGGIR